MENFLSDASRESGVEDNIAHQLSHESWGAVGKKTGSPTTSPFLIEGTGTPGTPEVEKKYIAIPLAISAACTTNALLEVSRLSNAKAFVSGSGNYANGLSLVARSSFGTEVAANARQFLKLSSQAVEAQRAAHAALIELDTASVKFMQFGHSYRGEGLQQHLSRSTSAEQKFLHHRRNAFFQNRFGWDSATATSVIGTEQQVLNKGSMFFAPGEKLFVAGSQEAVALERIEKAHHLHAEQLRAVRQLDDLVTQQKVKLSLAEGQLLNTPKSSAVARGMNRAYVTSALSIIGGYKADQIIAHNIGAEAPIISNSLSLLSDGVATPTLLVSELPKKYKLPAAVAIFGLTRAVNAHWVKKN